MDFETKRNALKLTVIKVIYRDCDSLNISKF